MNRHRQGIRILRDTWHILRRQMRRFARSPRLAIEYWRYRRKLRDRDWTGIRTMLRPASQAALSAGDFRFVTELGHAALRLEEYQLGMQLLLSARHMAGESKPTDWQGEDLSGATLLVELMENRKQAVAVGVTVAGYIREAARRAGNTVVVAEPRMVPLFERTLSGVAVLPFGADLTPHLKGRVVTATTVELAAILGYDEKNIGRFYTPIAGHRSEAQELRDRYLNGRSLPLIGIAWWSSHVGKDLPSVADWARLVRDVPAQFVSLQYAQSTADVGALQGADPEKFIVDASVDQLKDMDRFASQIAALDLVITISNSGAHLAGGMGQKMILVRDDLFRRSWPYLSRAVPWYPNTVVVGKDGREWAAVFDEVMAVARGFWCRKYS
jgi:hypothetical protein